MSQPESSKAAAAAKVILLALLALGGPVTAFLVRPDIANSPVHWALLTLCYEFALGVLAFMTQITGDVSKRWQKRAADSIDAWTQRRLSRFPRSYLRYIRAASRYLELKGLTTRAEHTLELDEIFVRLTLDKTAINKLSTNPIRRSVYESASDQTESIWHWMDQNARTGAATAIVGPPGSGKTTLLRYVAYTMASGGRQARAANSPRKIPVLVILRDHKDLAAGTRISLTDIIRRSLGPVTVPEPARWVEVSLSRGRFALLFDGLDEIPTSEGRRQVAAWLDDQVKNNNGNVVVVTSRKFGYQDNPLDGAIVTQVQPFTQAQIGDFVRRWYLATAARSHAANNESARLSATQGGADLLARLQQKPALYELASNPLLLTMIVNVHYYSGALPGSRSELYRQICDVFLGRRNQARGIHVEIPAAKKILVLRELAFGMMDTRILQIPAAKALKAIEEPLARVSDKIAPVDFLRDVEESAGIIVEPERGLYSYAHLTFQEYLAAEYITEHGLLNELASKIHESWWRETIRLVAALSDATPIVEACLAQHEDSTLLALAAQCVEEAREVLPTVRRAVSDRLHPRSVRQDRTARRIAAHARLLLRVSSDVQVQEGCFIGDPITNIEYQYFLDRSSGAERPDHWEDKIFPEGKQNDPVVGLNYESGRAFCDWMQSTLNDSNYYRLPTAEELDGLIETNGDSGKILSAWTITQSGSSNDGLFGLLVRDRRDSSRNVPHPPPLLQDSEKQLLMEIGGEEIRIVEATDFPHARNIFGGDAFHRRIAITELAADAWEAYQGSDAGQLERDLRAGSSLVQQYLDTFRISDGASLQSELGPVCKYLEEAANSYFYKTATLEHRRKIRIAVLQLSILFVQLEDLHRRATRRSIRSRWLGSQGAKSEAKGAARSAAVFAKAYMRMHVELLVLEGRYQGLVEPSECLYVVRCHSAQRPDEIPASVTEDPNSRKRVWLTIGKPAVDRVLALICLLLLSPPFLLIALAVKAQDGGPIFYKQLRVGRYGRPFSLIKFRTMVEHPPDRAQFDSSHEAPLFKLRYDPRVTPVGRILRRTSLDEIPSLFNILTGDMSLVGPRPRLPLDVSRMDRSESRILQLKPGLTGLYQVSGRSDLAWQTAHELEIEYLENVSLRLDAYILLRSFSAVASGRGAY